LDAPYDPATHRTILRAGNRAAVNTTISTMK
jgi:hypothetical protein